MRSKHRIAWTKAWPRMLAAGVTCVLTLNLSSCSGGSDLGLSPAMQPTKTPGATPRATSAPSPRPTMTPNRTPTPSATGTPRITSTPIPNRTPTPRPTPTPQPTNGKIVFDSNRDGNFEIYVMNPDGTGQTRLTHNVAADTFPVYSPDRRKIAFVSNRDGNNEIYVMNADGSNQTRLTPDPNGAQYPGFSADSRQIVFSAIRNNKPGLYVMNADGSGQRLLFAGPPFASSRPSWSPDGRKIIFTSMVPDTPTAAGVAPRDRITLQHIYSINTDGSGLTDLSGNPHIDVDPSYSPDGRRIVFSSSDNGSEIMIMNADGTGRITVTHTGNNYQPVFSPDGRKIAFVSYRDHNGEIYAMNDDGSQQTRLTSNQSDGENPDWR